MMLSNITKTLRRTATLGRRTFAIDLSAHTKDGSSKYQLNLSKCLEIDVQISPETQSMPIYFDNQSTTPMDPRVLDAMLPYLTNNYGNPHSKSHKYGWDTEQACEDARQHIANVIGA